MRNMGLYDILSECDKSNDILSVLFNSSFINFISKIDFLRMLSRVLQHAESIFIYIF